MKTILITGANDGIGRQTALEIAKSGHKVIIHARNSEKAVKAADEIKNESGNENIDFVTADLSELQQITKMAEDFKSRFGRLDVLINNAGVYMHNPEFNSEGVEMTLAINHLSYFALTLYLLDLLEKSTPSRIINVSSVAHRRGKIDFEDLNNEKDFDGYKAYAASKLANILFTNQLAEALKDKNITVNSLHPGVIGTKLLKKGFGISGSSLEAGAKTSVYLALSDKVRGVTGKYFDNCKEAATSKDAQNKDLALKLWKVSEELCGIKESVI